MLVLGRKKKQSIMIGDDVKIVVLEIADGFCRIGIDAPDEVLILRQELYTAPVDRDE